MTTTASGAGTSGQAIEKYREEIMRELSQLSSRVKDAGDMILFYAANRAWNELYAERHSPIISAARPGGVDSSQPKKQSET